MTRINRGIRSSPDKRPYKDHLDIALRCGDVKGWPAYWFGLRADELVLGRMDAHARQARATDASGAALAKTVAKVEKAGYDIGGQHYKRVPAGSAADHAPAAQRVHAGTQMGIPPEATTPRFPAFCAAHFKKLSPLIGWLDANVDSDHLRETTEALVELIAGGTPERGRVTVVGDDDGRCAASAERTQPLLPRLDERPRDASSAPGG